MKLKCNYKICLLSLKLITPPTPALCNYTSLKRMTNLPLVSRRGGHSVHHYYIFDWNWFEFWCDCLLHALNWLLRTLEITSISYINFSPKNVVREGDIFLLYKTLSAAGSTVTHSFFVIGRVSLSTFNSVNFIMPCWKRLMNTPKRSFDYVVALSFSLQALFVIKNNHCTALLVSVIYMLLLLGIRMSGFFFQ